MSWLTDLLRSTSQPAVGEAPERGNLFSLAERRALRALAMLAPPICGFCGERRPAHMDDCCEHPQSHHHPSNRGNR